MTGTDEVAGALRSLGLSAPGRCPTCNVSTALLGATCKHCKERFCLAHAQAEVHGCGPDARKAARAGVRAEVAGLPARKPSALQDKARAACVNLRLRLAV